MCTSHTKERRPHSSIVQAESKERSWQAFEKNNILIYNPEWAERKDFEWIWPTEGDLFSATCFWCLSKLSVKYEGKKASEIHAKAKKHHAILNKQATIT